MSARLRSTGRRWYSDRAESMQQPVASARHFSSRIRPRTSSPLIAVTQVLSDDRRCRLDRFHSGTGDLLSDRRRSPGLGLLVARGCFARKVSDALWVNALQSAVTARLGVWRVAARSIAPEASDPAVALQAALTGVVSKENYENFQTVPAVVGSGGCRDSDRVLTFHEICRRFCQHSHVAGSGRPQGCHGKSGS